MDKKSPVSIATKSDLTQIELLLNKAYRGEESKKGWTTEADLIEGEIRIDTPTLTKVYNKPGSVFLKYEDPTHHILGCVNLQKKGNELYLGMLSVSPLAQGNGIGKRLMDESEHYASEHSCNKIYMHVISVREELIKWYERHGYYDTGRKVPFPEHEGFGKPRRPLEFTVLEKNLPAS